MKKNNKNTIISAITASLLLITTGCSQAAETSGIIITDATSDSSVTAISTESTEAETSAETAARTTAEQTTTAAHTTTAVVTTVPATEAQHITVQTEAAPAPVITTTTTAAPVVIPPKTTTTTTMPKPEEPVQEDRSYLNLTPSEVQGILDECQRYAESLGYRKVTYDEYLNEMDELTKKAIDLYKNTDISQDEAYEKVGWYEWEKSLCITDVPTDEFWSGNWHYIMYAGNFTKKYDNVYQFDGYDTHCSTKEESIQWVTDYLKYWIDVDHSEGYSVSITGTKLRDFDNYGKEKGDWGIVSYETIRQEYYTGDFVYDLDTSYAFSVKGM